MKSMGSGCENLAVQLGLKGLRSTYGFYRLSFEGLGLDYVIALNFIEALYLASSYTPSIYEMCKTHSYVCLKK